jgi:arylsulfatase
LPTNQGFDEWWGIPNTSDEAGYTAHPLFTESGLPAPQVWEGVKGQPSRPAGDFDLQTRPLMDEQIVRRTAAFLERQAAGGKPFFIYVGLTQIHPPMLVHPAFAGKSGGGMYSDVLTEMDYRVGQILDALAGAGLADDTLVIFSSDNAAAHLAIGGGSNGPWRGDFFTPPFEGSHRAPAMVRWPGRIAAGTVTDEIYAAVDWLPTIAALVGEAARVPTDRPIDGLDSSAFLLGREPRSNRDSFIFYGHDGELMSVKWRTIKAIFRYQEGMTQVITTPRFPMLYDLLDDPGERSNLWETRMDTTWMLAPVFQRISALRHSMARYPNIEPGQEFTGYS